MRRSTWKQHVASEAQLTSMLDHARENWPNGRAPCQQEPLLAIGVLTLPVLVRTPELRRYHRAVHYTQAPVAQGRVCLRYLVSGVEMYNLTHKAASAVREENGTFGDMLVLPSVPHGPIRRAVADAKSGPLGAGCVLKVLSWLQHAAEVEPMAPFIAYGDDDTFWALTRVQETLLAMQPREAFRLDMYMGAMQYHGFWDFAKMTSAGWYWTLPAAGKGYAADFKASTAMPMDANQATQSIAHLFHRPYPMAHGMGVIVSNALGRRMGRAPAIANFLHLYEAWLLHSSIGQMEARSSMNASH